MLGVNTPALPASLRRRNQRTLISLLLRLGSASRADLAKAAGISQPTAGKIIAELLKLGLVQETNSLSNSGHSRASPRLGRPGQSVAMESRRSRFIAIEVGVTHTSISALPVAGSSEDQWQHRFRTPDSPQDWLREIKRISRVLSCPGAWGVLVSLPGVVDEQAGRVLFSPNLHWLEHTHISDQLRRIWKLPVIVIQEIRALALGHLTATGGEDFFLVDFGQGVGGAVVVNGQLSSNPVPLSGEVGHTPISGNRRQCGCGATGCLETLISQDGLLRSFRPRPGGWDALVRRVHANPLEPWLAQALVAAGQTIAGALNVLGIRRVVVTGLLDDFPAAVTDFLFSEIRQGAMWARFGEVICELAPRRRAAGLVATGLDRLVLPEDSHRAEIHRTRLSFPPLSPEPTKRIDHNTTAIST